MAKKANKEVSAVDVNKRPSLALNNCTKEDWDKAWAFRQQLQEWLMEKGGCPDTEMMTLWVGWDGDVLEWNGRDVAIKIMPNDANGESQYLWDLYCLSESEDEFIEKFKEWRGFLRQRQAVDEADNVVNITDGETL